MARIRSVKPDLRTSKLVASWPFEMRYFFVLFWGYLDDKGRGLDVPKTIAGDCFPHDEKVTPSKVDKWLDRMTLGRNGKEGPICRYEIDGIRYIHAVNWKEHQKPNRPTPSRLPQCPLHARLTESLTESGHPQGPVDEGGSRQLLDGNQVSKSSRDQNVTVIHTSNTYPAPPQSRKESEVDAPRISESLNGSSVPGGGEKGRRGEGEGGNAEPPPSRCPEHENNPTPGRCGQCGDARRARQAWDAAASDRAGRQAEADRFAIRACQLCNGDGQRWHPDSKGNGTVGRCDHQPLPRQEPA